MSDGLVFLQMFDPVSTFISHLISTKFSIWGYYYTTTISGPSQTFCYLIDLSLGQVPSWFNHSLTIDQLKTNSNIKSIYLAPIKPESKLTGKLFKQWQLEVLDYKFSILTGPHLFYTLIKNLNQTLSDRLGLAESIDLSYLSLSEKDKMPNIDLFRRLAETVDFIQANTSLYLSSKAFDPLILYYNRIEKVHVDSSELKNWIKTQVDAFFEDPPTIISMQIEPTKTSTKTGKLQRFLEGLKEDILSGKEQIVKLSINELLAAFNKSVGNKKIALLEGEYSIPIVGIISREKEEEINLKFQNGRYDIITTKSFDINRFDVEQLKEILIAIDVTMDKQVFEDLQVAIVERIIELEKI